MKSNIFIPQIIKVGYQNRSDTYTGKLAYVIYFDEKNKLRKEASWKSWCDEKIGSNEFDNAPTSGFVLNKKVGDYSSGWDHRKAYTRIYDPRGFEFEIDVTNLLYILENTNSIKGKGLEGDFVYGWDGKDLILIPTSSPDYIELSQFSETMHSNRKFVGKEMIVGATYKNRSNEDVVYIGRFDEFSRKYDCYGYRYDKDKKTNHLYFKDGKKYWFHTKTTNWNGESYDYFFTTNSLNTYLIDLVDEKCVADYPDIYEKLLLKWNFNPPVDVSKNEFLEFKETEFDISKISYFYSFVDGKYIEYKINRGGWGGYYNNRYYSIERKVSARNSEKIEDDIRENQNQHIFIKYKPLYLQQYTKNNELYKENAQ